MSSGKIIFIVGPTAVGKSDVAYKVAQGIQGEIVSCDSMQVYKEICIASNKPPQRILDKVPHHLVNILSVWEEFDVARFDRLASTAVKEIHCLGRIPVVVGGSGLYMQVLLDGIFEEGIKNEVLRRDLREQARRWGNHFLYDKLKADDPEAAGKIHPNDLRRVVRALEICVTAKKPISQLKKNRAGLWGKYDISLFALNRERQELYERIDARVDHMFRHGVVEEVQRLKDVPWSRTAKTIIGVREILGFLNAEYSLEEAKALMKLNTRHLAKRQLTWFRGEKRLEWITVPSGNAPGKAAQAIMDKWKSERREGCL